MSKEQAMDFLKKVAEAENLSSQVQKGDINNTIKVAAQHGYKLTTEDIWAAITHLQKDRASLARNIPSWIIDRLRVAVHD